MESLELKVPPVILVVIAAAGMWVLSGLSPNSSFRFPGAAWLGAVPEQRGRAVVAPGVRPLPESFSDRSGRARYG